MTEGSQVFFVLKTGERTRKVSGVVVELFEKEAVVGFLGELLEGVMWAGAPLAICGFLTALYPLPDLAVGQQKYKVDRSVTNSVNPVMIVMLT